MNTTQINEILKLDIKDRINLVEIILWHNSSSNDFSNSTSTFDRMLTSVFCIVLFNSLIELIEIRK